MSDVTMSDVTMSDVLTLLSLVPLLPALCTLVVIGIAYFIFHRSTSLVHITELWIHPIKSCGGFKVDAAKLLRSGLQWDREFAICNAQGEVLSQKTYPKLAEILPKPHCTRGADKEAAPGPDVTLTGLTLHAADEATGVFVDLTATPTSCVTSWGGNSEPLNADLFDAATPWLSARLGFECSLVRLTSRRSLRTTRLAPVAHDAKDCCRYQDGAPLTMLSEASVRMLSSKFGNALPPCRFRPNIVVGGCIPLAESSWTGLEISGVETSPSEGERRRVGIKPLMEAYRCTMVTIVQVGLSLLCEQAGLDSRTPAGTD